MPDTFWLDEYRQKAALADPVAQSGRGHRFEAVEFLHVVRQMLGLLDLRPHHTLADVGCACGLLTIPLSACCRHIIAVEPVDELRALLQTNTAAFDNVEVLAGHAAALPLDAHTCDRVLMLEVVQLIAPSELPAVCAELRRVARPRGRIVIASVPDAEMRDAFLGPYLVGVEAATHLSPDEKRRIVARNQAAHWHSRDEFRSIWSAFGGRCEFRSLPKSDPHAGHRFHLVVTLAE
ncbi:MAG: class I SAM-dependent methyltransferase [Phycisphaerae bacterium]